VSPPLSPTLTRNLADFCWIHYRVERPDGTSYRICSTCGHLFRSAFELWRVTVRRRMYFGRPSRTVICPYCGRDSWTT
jgi:hypothetical protein